MILGYHGTDESTAKKVINNRHQLLGSDNQYDWLGNGIYFWENDPQRAKEYIIEKFKREKIRKKTAVIGAIIDLGFCLNLLERVYIDEVKLSYDYLTVMDEVTENEFPRNHSSLHTDTIPLKRDLDCAVIQNIHLTRKNVKLPEYDTVRSAFIEGDELYHNAGFKKKNHIQVCVRNQENILGYFWPPLEED